MEAASTKSAESVLLHFQLDPNVGLTNSQVESSLQKHGHNELPPEVKESVLSLVIDAFKDRLVLILLCSAGISLALSIMNGEGSVEAYFEPGIIILILVMNALVQVIQDLKSESAIKALSKHSPQEAKVLRSGNILTIPSAQLVPGDIIHLSAGDRVPADCRIIEIHTSALEVDQSIFTGESDSVEKTIDACLDADIPKSEQKCMLFSGTTVSFGKASAVVVQAGKNTALGSIQMDIEGIKNRRTPLRVSLDRFGDQLSKIIAFICVFVWVISWKHFMDKTMHRSWLSGALYYLKVSVSLAVAAIPEGLSVIITTSLALGTRKMTQKGMLIRKLQSMETLGCTTVICTDKTGTLTTNKMCVRTVAALQGGELKFLTSNNSTLSPFGKFEACISSKLSESAVKSLCFPNIALVSLICNNTRLAYDFVQKEYVGVGEATEAALVSMAEKLYPCKSRPASGENLSLEEKVRFASVAYDEARESFQLVNSLDFTRDRKVMSVVVESKGNGGSYFESGTVLLVKGAPEYVLDKSTSYRDGKKVMPLTEQIRGTIYSSIQNLCGERSLRVIGFAYKPNPGIPDRLKRQEYDNVESRLTFLGLAGMEDPLRENVVESVASARNAGVKVVVVTGDNKKTAESVCRKLSLFGENEDLQEVSFTGRDLELMSEEKLRSTVNEAKLFSRTEPHHKSMLVSALRKNGNIVAMTGDGVNDAVALKLADIGVSMGSGTDVAKLASDMILVNDDFTAIVGAIEEGRVVFANTRQFIRYLISSNIGEVFSIVFTIALGIPESIKPVQLLWVNLVTDGLPATALGFNPPDDDTLLMPPRDPNGAIVTAWLLVRYVIVGMYVGLSTVMGYIWSFTLYSKGPKISLRQLMKYHDCYEHHEGIDCSMFISGPARRASTVSLSILVVVEMFNSINSVSENKSVLEVPFTRNPKLVMSIAFSMFLHLLILYVDYLSKAFSIESMDLEEWAFTMFISFPIILVDEILKLLSRKMAMKRRKKA